MPNPTADPETGAVEIALREPFAGHELLAFLAHRAVTGVEYVDGRTYARTLTLPSGAGTVHLTFPEPGKAAVVVARFRLDHPADLDAAVEQCRRLIDADADPHAVDRQLARDPALAASVRQCPGLRAPGAVNGPEILLRAIFGQQVSVAAARTTLGRLTAAVGRPMAGPIDERLTHLFPAPTELAALDPADIPGPRRRAGTVVAVNQAITIGDLVVEPGRDQAELTRELLAQPGIGPWTAHYVSLRVLHDPDVLMTGDLVLRQGATALGLPADPPSLLARAERWRPYRSYAGLHLWRAAGRRTSTPG